MRLMKGRIKRMKKKERKLDMYFLEDESYSYAQLKVSH